jgi:putative hydroxymethylpyrimidine transporter CytX
MGLWGPLGVVRQWLGRFAVWIVLATSLWLTFVLLTRYDLAALLARPAAGGLPFGTALDIVIAMPVSWLPLVADYSRFARHPRSAFWGTALGYLVANVWFYALGAVILLAAGVTQEPKGFVEAVALLAGPLALLILLVDETDEAWADLYSCAVSIQNGFPAAPLRPLVLGLGALAWLVALRLDVTQYETFLLLIGSVFVPLFGVLAADYFLLQGRYEPAELTRPGGLYAQAGGVSWPGLLAWAGGILVYHAVAGNLARLGLPGTPWLGASLPGLVAAGLIYLVLARSRAPAPAAGRR